MRDLAFLLATGVSLVGLHLWHRWWLPYAVLAAVNVLERPRPENAPLGLVAGELTVADTRWGSATWPAVWVDLVP